MSTAFASLNPAGLQLDEQPKLGLVRPLTVLVVDSNSVYREQVAAIAHADGYDVLTARCPAETFELLASPKHASRTIDLLVVDSFGPALEGLELAYRIGKNHPNLKIILITERMGSFLDGLLSVQVDNLEVVNKPISPDVLTASINRLFAE